MRIFPEVIVYVCFISTRALASYEQLNDQLWVMIGLWKKSLVRTFQSNMINAFCVTSDQKQECYNKYRVLYRFCHPAVLYIFESQYIFKNWT